MLQLIAVPVIRYISHALFQFATCLSVKRGHGVEASQVVHVHVA